MIHTGSGKSELVYVDVSSLQQITITLYSRFYSLFVILHETSADALQRLICSSSSHQWLTSLCFFFRLNSFEHSINPTYGFKGPLMETTAIGIDDVQKPSSQIRAKPYQPERFPNNSIAAN